MLKIKFLIFCFLFSTSTYAFDNTYFDSLALRIKPDIYKFESSFIKQKSSIKNKLSFQKINFLIKNKFDSTFETKILCSFRLVKDSVTFIEQIDDGFPNYTCSPDDLKPFKSDGCSLFPDGTVKNKNLWCECCFSHDIAYYQGGTKEERLKADEDLKNCIIEKTNDHNLANMVYQGVRTGGSWIYPTWYRWGYGWPYGRGYKALTKEEKEAVKKMLDEYLKKEKIYNCGEDN